MPVLRVTLNGLALVINRSTAPSLVVFPTIKHKFRVVGPKTNKTFSPGVDIRLADAKGNPLEDEPTSRPTTEYVAHLDQITNTSVKLPDILVGSAFPQRINARFFLTGGALHGLPAVAHGGLLRNVLWTFDSDKSKHTQKLTDTIVFSRELPVGEYSLLLKGKTKTTTIPIDLRKVAAVDCTMANEDECPDPPLPDYELTEPPALFAVAGLSNFNPHITGDPCTGLGRSPKRHKARNAGPKSDPTGSVCDDICPGFQAEG